MPPPIFRFLVLISTAIVLIAIGLAVGEPRNTAAQTTVPAPGNVTASTGPRPSTIDLAWSRIPSSDLPSGDTVVNYQVRWRSAHRASYGGSWGEWMDIGGARTTSYTVTISETWYGSAQINYTLYNIQLRAAIDDGDADSAADYYSSIATVVNTRTGLATPADLAATLGPNTGEVNLTWTAQTTFDASFTAAKYQYRAKLTSDIWPPGGGWTDIPGSNYMTSAYTVTGLAADQRHHIQLRFIATSSLRSAASQIQFTLSVPAPQGFYAVSSTTTTSAIELFWTELAFDPSTQEKYQYRWKSTTAQTYNNWRDIPGSDYRTDLFTLTDIVSGSDYDIQIRIHWSDSVGAGPPATTKATASGRTVSGVPLEPRNFKAVPGTNRGTIDLSWDAVPGVSGYEFNCFAYQGEQFTHCPEDWMNIGTGTTYTLTAVPLIGAYGGDRFFVSLRAVTTASQSPSVDAESLVQPQPHPHLRTRPGHLLGSIHMAWDPPSAGGIIHRYEYRYHLGYSLYPRADVPWSTVPDSDGDGVLADERQYTITGLRVGEAYSLAIRVLTDVGYSNGYGGDIDEYDYTEPQHSASRSALQNVTAKPSETTVGAIDLAWKQLEPEVDVLFLQSDAKYQVRYKLSSSSWPAAAPYGWADVADGPDTDSHAYDEHELTITRLTRGQRYDIELRFHYNERHEGTPAVKVGALASSTKSRTRKPTGFDVTTGSGPGEIDLVWNAASGASGYQYRCSPAGSGCRSSWQSAGTGTSYTLTGLTGGSFYNVQVRSLSTGFPASAATVTKRAQAQRTPGPASLSFSYGRNPGELRIDWTAPANNGPVEHYEYRYKHFSPDSTYSIWQVVPDGNDRGSSQADEVTTTITGLRVKRRYEIQFRVYASSSIGYSLPQTGLQLPLPVPPPTRFMATTGNRPGEVDLTWRAPTGVTILRYELRHGPSLNGPFSSLTSTGTATTYTYTGLRPNKRIFEVRAVMRTVGESHWQSMSATPAPVPSPAPFTATTGTFPGEVDLSWNAVNGATGYQWRYQELHPNFRWSVDTPWLDVAHPSITSLTFSAQKQGTSYAFEVRAFVRDVGTSNAVFAVGRSRSPNFIERLVRWYISRHYSVQPAETPGRVTVRIPREPDPDPFIYRHRTANPGEWSRWFKVVPQPNQEQYLIPDLDHSVRYEIEVRAYTGPTTGFTTALSQEVQANPLEAPASLDVRESSGVIHLSWPSPNSYTPDSYEYRSRPTGAPTWSDWTEIQHQGDRGADQQHMVTDLESGVTYQFELRIVTNAGKSPVATAGVTSRVTIPDVDSIEPEVRKVTVRAGETIRLAVDVYNAQQVLENGLATSDDSLLVFSWSEGTAGGGSFAESATGRRIEYTTPSSPGTYTVTAEAQPDGICLSHHASTTEITAADRKPCIATFTIRVTRAVANAVPQPDPINPPGIIPTSLTDNEGIAYTVFTPAAGGTFTGESVTVSAPAGAVPDRSLLGISASVSGVPTPAPVPGASMSVAGRYYDINAITQAGTAPLTSYTLDEPLMACLPYPDEFRADLSNVVLVQRAADGELGILSTTVRTNAGTLTVCGAVSTLPATVGVAKLGTVPATPPTPMPEEETPDTGGAAPSATMVVLSLISGLLLLAGAILLAGIYNSVRRNSSLATLPTFTAIGRVGRTVRV